MVTFEGTRVSSLAFSLHERKAKIPHRLDLIYRELVFKYNNRFMKIVKSFKVVIGLLGSLWIDVLFAQNLEPKLKAKVDANIQLSQNLE